MPTLLPRKSMGDTSVISPPIQRPSPSDHRVGSSSSFTRLRVGSLALRPALLLCENLRPRVTTTPLPHATEAYGQLPGRDLNPLDLLLLLRTVRSRTKNIDCLLRTMTRARRLEFPNALYHVTSRGNAAQHNGRKMTIIAAYKGSSD